MKVLLNTSGALPPLTGIGRYITELHSALLLRKVIEVVPFSGFARESVATKHPFLSGIARESVRRFRLRKILKLIDQKKFDRFVSETSPTLYHEPSYVGFRYDGPLVITVHDLSWIRYPEYHPLERVKYLNDSLPRSVENASAIITDSEFIRSEVIAHFGVNPTRVFSVPLAAKDIFRPAEPEHTAPTLNRLGLTHGRYWLALGTLEPRKNLRQTLLAFARLSPKQRRRCPLVLAGASGWEEHSFGPEIRALERLGHVISLGYVATKDLAMLTAGARAVIYASIYEGFGLPPLEAMACGVPVIASNCSSIPEVVGSAGYLVDPNDEMSIFHALNEVDENPGLRESLSRKGLQRSMGFSWARCADLTINVYKNALATPL